ncbi:MAG: pitrilysin family protein [Candidatus Krumholzibacteriia bacterium]
MRIRHSPRPSRARHLAPVLRAALAAGLLAAAGAPSATVADPVTAPAGAVFLDEPLEPVFYEPPANVELLTLENGLPVVLMRNPAQPMVGIYTQVKVGSAYEDFRTSGMTHMLEHLLFNGTERYTQDELYAAADRAGAYNNANTSDFYTNFMMVLPAAELATGMELQSQMLFHSVLPPEKFEKEKGIVLGELVAARDRPGTYTQTVLREALYAGSDLDLPTLGTRATIEHLDRDDVHAFYRAWYVPNNMVVTVAGNFERDQALALLNEHYGSVPPGTLPAQTVRPPEHIERTRTVVRRGGGRRVAALAFEAPGYGSPDHFAFLVAATLLDAPGTGILTRALGRITPAERPDVSTWWERGPGFGRLVMTFDLSSGFRPESCYPLVQEAVATALDEGVTAGDVAEVVAMKETETLLQREQLRMTGIYAAESLTLGGPDFFASYLARLREVEPEQVARALDMYLADTPCLAVLVEPLPVSGGGPAPHEGMQEAGRSGHGGGAGAHPELPATMPPAMAEAMRKMREGGGAAADGSDPPAEEPPARPQDRSSSALPVERSVLQNGAVLVTRTNPDSPILAVHLTVKGRALLDRECGATGAMEVVHRLLDDGVGSCDEACLARRLRRLGAQVKLVDDPRIPMDDYYTEGRFSFVRAEVAAERGPELLELLADMIRRPGFDAGDFERERQAQRELVVREAGSARELANDLLREALYGEHPLALDSGGTAAGLDVLTYDDVRALARKAFAPENLVFAVVSPHAHEELAQRLEASLPGRGEPTPGLPPLPATGEPERRTASVGGEMAAIRLGSILAVDLRDEAALELLIAIISDRVAMDLRETRGLSYSVGAGIDVRGERAALTAWINPPRERADEAEEALGAALAGFDPGTVTQDEFDRVRAARQGRAMLRRLSSISQAYHLALAELEGDVSRYLDAVSRYDQVTLDDLRRVHARYLAELPLVTVVVD